MSVQPTCKPSSAAWFALAALTAGFALTADPALAQTTSTAGGNIGTFIQNIINLLNNNVTRGLAIIAIIVAGIAWMFGHLDLRRAGTVIIGIIVIFGASTIVDMITGASGS
jgi:type IV secretory pathway VirB2 component (pilin)